MLKKITFFNLRLAFGSCLGGNGTLIGVFIFNILFYLVISTITTKLPHKILFYYLIYLNKIAFKEKNKNYCQKIF